MMIVCRSEKSPGCIGQPPPEMMTEGLINSLTPFMFGQKIANRC
jgi:hypothetical protein